jgi:hypothetical protein
MTLALSLATGGCFTTRAHQLVLSGNPLRDQAIACERECRWLQVPAGKPCEQTFAGASCREPDAKDRYAECLDTCPGAGFKDGGSCPRPAAPGVICVETTQANPGPLAGGVLGVGGVVAGILITSAIVTSPWWLVFIFVVH